MVLSLHAAAFKTFLPFGLWQLISNVAVVGPNLRQEILVSDLIEDQLGIAGYLSSLGVLCLEHNSGAAIGAAYLKNLWFGFIKAFDSVLASGQRGISHNERKGDICLNGTLAKCLRLCGNVSDPY